MGASSQSKNRENGQALDGASDQLDILIDNFNKGSRDMTVFDVIKFNDASKFELYLDAKEKSVLCLRDEGGHTAAHWACLLGNLEILQVIEESGVPLDDPSSSGTFQHPIHWACVGGHVHVVEHLCNRRVSPDTVDATGATPLMVAAQYGHTVLCGYLVGRGSSISLVDENGDNAFHWAACKGHVEVIRLLMYSGFDPKATDKYKQTALHLAAIGGHLDCIKLLSEQDIELNTRDSSGRSPLMHARDQEHEQVFEFLKKKINKRDSIISKINLRTILFGPPGNTKVPLLIFLGGTLFWCLPEYILNGIPMTYDDLWPLHWVFMSVSCVMYICLYHAGSIDPGFVPRNTEEYTVALRQLSHASTWTAGFNPMKRLCFTCKAIKPLRSKHCRFCDRCVRNFDHHCPYIYNCVGYNNRGSFLVMVCCVFISGWIGVFFQYYVHTLQGWKYRHDYALGAAVSLFYLGIATTLAYFSVKNAFINATTNEQINYKRYDHMHDSNGLFVNPFDRGYINNMKEYFYLKKPVDQELVFPSAVKSL